GARGDGGIEAKGSGDRGVQEQRDGRSARATRVERGATGGGSIDRPRRRRGERAGVHRSAVRLPERAKELVARRWIRRHSRARSLGRVLETGGTLRESNVREARSASPASWIHCAAPSPAPFPRSLQASVLGTHDYLS